MFEITFFIRFLPASRPGSPFPAVSARFASISRSLPGRPLRTFRRPFILPCPLSTPLHHHLPATSPGQDLRFRPFLLTSHPFPVRFPAVPRSLPGRPLRTFRRPFILPCPLYSVPSPSSRRFHSRSAFSQTPIPRSGHLSFAPTPLYSAQSQPSQPLRSRPAFSQTPIPRSGHLSFAPTPLYSAQSPPSQPLRSRPAFSQTPIPRSGHLHSPLHLFTPLNRRLPSRSAPVQPFSERPYPVPDTSIRPYTSLLRSIAAFQATSTLFRCGISIFLFLFQVFWINLRIYRKQSTDTG